MARHSRRSKPRVLSALRFGAGNAALATVCLTASVMSSGAPAAGAAQKGEMIDRVLAVVDGQVLTLSDVRTVLKFELVPPDVTDDPVGAALQRLIDRRLILAEVDRYAPAEPPEYAVNARVTAVQARFKDEEAFEGALNQTSMSREGMRRFIRDSMRIETYMQQRFSSSAQPSDDEIARYYKEHASDFTVNGVLQPLPSVREQVRTQMVAERHALTVSEWLADLRRRGSIIELPRVVR